MHIATTMERSMRRGVGEIIAHSVKRTITGEVSSVQNTFSSWDNCMAKSYCKWPVIIGIVIGGLIVLSIISCIARACCCGYSCCCACFSFLKCCDCCGDSCAGKKNKPHKYADGPSPFAPRQGYQAPVPMMGGALPSRPEAPRYAQFEVGKGGFAVDPKPALSEDALPPMPSWDTASKKHVLSDEEKDAVELGELNPSTGQKMPLMSGAAATGLSAPPSPRPMGTGRAESPFGARPAPGPNPGNYMGVGADRAYNNGSPALGGYRGNGSPAPGSYRGNGSPAPDRGNGRGGFGGQGRYDPNSQGRRYGQSPQDQYGDNFQNGYGRPHPGSDYSSNSNRPFQPPRQYTNDSSRSMNPERRGYNDSLDPGYPRPSQGLGGAITPLPDQHRVASPRLQNNSGFDFGGDDYGAPAPRSRPSPPLQQGGQGGQSGYGRRPSPPQMPGAYEESEYGGSTAPPTYVSRSPPQQQEPAYPGYRPYRPDGNVTPQRVGTPQGSGRREPRPWDPVRQ